MSFRSLCRWTMDVRQSDDSQTGDRMGKRDVYLTVAESIPCIVHDARPEDVLAFGRQNERVTCRVHFRGPVVTIDGPIRLDPTHQLVIADIETGATRYMKVKAEKKPVATSMPHVAHCEEQVT